MVDRISATMCEFKGMTELRGHCGRSWLSSANIEPPRGRERPEGAVRALVVPPSPPERVRDVSGDQFDGSIGIEQHLGGGPAGDDAHDSFPCTGHKPSGGIEDPQAQCVRSDVRLGSVEAEELEPQHEVGRDCNKHCRS